MIKLFFSLALMFSASEASAIQSNSTQLFNITANADSSVVAQPAQVSINEDLLVIPEPEFINSYYILTSDSTFAVLPKENGKIAKHKNKTGSLLNKIGKVANVVSAVGGLGAVVGANVGNIGTVLSGVRTVSTAVSVGNVADAAGALVSANGMDIVFAGKKSAYEQKMDGKDVRVLIKADNNEYDPHGIYRVVKFVTSKKERRIQWMEFDSPVIDDSKKKKGYIPFTAKKYGKQSYMLTIPASEIEEGEYGIFFMGIETAAVIPVGTFSISE